MTSFGTQGGASLREIEGVYRRRFGQYASVAAAILRDRDAGRDVVQDAFAKAVQTRRSFRRDGSLEGWLLRAVVNTALDERRRRGSVHAVPGSGNGSFPDGARAESDVPDAIALLPERQRLVLFLRYYADLDYRAIAETLGISTGTVAATLHAAHGAVRRHLQEVDT